MKGSPCGRNLLMTISNQGFFDHDSIFLSVCLKELELGIGVHFRCKTLCHLQQDHHFYLCLGIIFLTTVNTNFNNKRLS